MWPAAGQSEQVINEQSGSLERLKQEQGIKKVEFDISAARHVTLRPLGFSIYGSGIKRLLRIQYKLHLCRQAKKQKQKLQFPNH